MLAQLPHTLLPVTAPPTSAALRLCGSARARFCHTQMPIIMSDYIKSKISFLCRKNSCFFFKPLLLAVVVASVRPLSRRSPPLSSLSRVAMPAACQHLR